MAGYLRPDAIHAFGGERRRSQATPAALLVDALQTFIDRAELTGSCAGMPAHMARMRG
jgi:hypothetical protein